MYLNHLNNPFNAKIHKASTNEMSAKLYRSDLVKSQNFNQLEIGSTHIVPI